MLKLFVVGERSPDPEEWSRRHWFVIAHDQSEAERLAMEKPATEIPMTTPMVLGDGDSGWPED